MVVRENVAVLRDEKARAARGGLHGLAEVVGRGGNVDGHHAVDVRGIDLRHRHLRLAVHLDGLHLRNLAVADLHARVVHLGGGAACARADKPADERAHQRKCDDLGGTLLLSAAAAAVLIRRLVGIVLCVDGDVGIVLIPLAIAVMIQVVFVFVHGSDLLWNGFRVCGPLSFDAAIIGDIYV